MSNDYGVDLAKLEKQLAPKPSKKTKPTVRASGRKQKGKAKK